MIKAKKDNLDLIENIVVTTIAEVYPKYYPSGVVDFFINHHNKQNINADIENGMVYYLIDHESAVGTVTIKENNINRLFVLPEFQGNGYGTTLLEFAENRIFRTYEEASLHVSLAAKHIYLKHGYKEMEYHRARTENGDYLCVDVMKKKVHKVSSKINYDGRIFGPINNSENGELDDQTVFSYHQKDNVMWAEYTGGYIIKGTMIGKVATNGELDFTYQHINTSGKIRIGKCHSNPVISTDGKLEMHEQWQWMNGDCSKGYSVVVEQKGPHKIERKISDFSEKH
ncbi:MAG: GNAT family N-acetyltransferase [bacterium]|nr:GNAT family N-acetyltransferase [bacterium]